MTGRRYSFGEKYDSQFFEDAVVHEKMWLGKGHWDNTTQYFEGSIDELRIYNRALTGDEVRNLYSVQTTEVQDHNDKSGIAVYPNPSGGTLHYNLSESDEKIQHIRVTDINGQIVFNEAVVSNESELYVGNLPEGLYFVDFIGQKESFHERIVISY